MSPKQSPPLPCLAPAAPFKRAQPGRSARAASAAPVTTSVAPTAPALVQADRPAALRAPRRRLLAQLTAALASVTATASGLGLGLTPGLSLAQTAPRPQGKVAATPAPVLGSRPEIQAWLDDIATKNGLDRAELTGLFNRAQRLDRVLELMTAPSRPGARRIWSEYRGRFVDPVRINDGVAFWKRHAAAVTLASERSGVPEAIMVAIIGVETVYGRHTGDFRVIETLATLGFDYEPRAPYFRGELEQFLLYARENRLDPMQPRGSYAGAMGLPQFMPTSLRRWAVDLDGDGRIDLSNSPADAIGSVGNFLKAHGWVAGKATHYAATVQDEAAVADLLAAGPKPSFTVEQLYGRAVQATEEVPVSEQLLLVDLPEGDNPTQYVLGTENFYAITRYNRSFFYAMAVIELANALKKAR